MIPRIRSIRRVVSVPVPDQPILSITPTADQAAPVATANEVLHLSDHVRAQIVQEKATCPFLGTAIATGNLAVRHDANNPLAGIDDVRKLGNSGGGDLGDLLVLFAQGNHALMKGATGQLNQPAPQGLFSLELPGSQGSHPGHSGILQGDPAVLGSGRLSEADFQRLVGRARDGLIKRSAVGGFIAENLLRDPASKVFGLSVTGLLARDLGQFVAQTGPALMEKLTGSRESAAEAHRELFEKLTKLTGEDNIVGSAGEFGLLFAFLANKPGAKTIDGEPALSVEDLRAMFVDKRFPAGWDAWKKTSLDWVVNTTGLLLSAGREYLRLKISNSLPP